jgi:hypothetical protein
MSENRFVLENEMRICRQLIEMTNTIFILLQRSHAGMTLSEKQTVLFAHILRARTMAGVCLLLAEQGHLEELWTVSRSMTELVINAAYLHVATDQEVTNYIYFDGHKIASQAAKLITHRPPPTPLSRDLVDQVGGVASSSRGLTGLEDNKATWSRFNLLARAQETDKHF